MTPASPIAKNLHLFSRLLALFLGVSSVLSLPVNPFQPNCTAEATYTSIEGRGLYVQGGYGDSLITVPDAFMIDLSKSWNTDKPLYTEMTPGRRHNYSPGGISSDGQRWVVYVDGLAWLYEAKTKNWTMTFDHHIRGMYALTGVTDPKTDMLYIPFGYPNVDGTMGTLRVDIKAGTAASDFRDFTLPYQKLYTASWNSHLNSVVYVSPSGVYSYTWEQGWKQLNTTGLDEVSPRGACLVSVSGGKKMALFGGSNGNETALLTDIYLLDVDKGEWTKGPAVSIEDARRSPACAGSNDQVVIWGGVSTIKLREFHCPAQQVLVFDVKTTSWTTKYIAPGEEQTSAMTSTR
ncbi:hypothetical protein B0O80DRAFT_425308 [Mortierella sp. GBAus27b]|nr:hypothetical protein BGX31_000910 [Mortierella sp. GBA43]KAI8356448.1 hypothetical protein B0O80DRAFT_425308 [Mortierella sp. GBAus27b]